jgi:hypothetical protein
MAQCSIRPKTPLQRRQKPREAYEGRPGAPRALSAGRTREVLAPEPLSRSQRSPVRAGPGNPATFAFLGYFGPGRSQLPGANIGITFTYAGLGVASRSLTRRAVHVLGWKSE